MVHGEAGQKHGSILTKDMAKNSFHWIGLRENLQEPPIFNGKNHGFL